MDGVLLNSHRLSARKEPHLVSVRFGNVFALCTRAVGVEIGCLNYGFSGSGFIKPPVLRVSSTSHQLSLERK